MRSWVIAAAAAGALLAGCANLDSAITVNQNVTSAVQSNHQALRGLAEAWFDLHYEDLGQGRW